MRNGILWSMVFAIAGVLLAALGLCIGSVHVPFSEVWGALSGSLPDGTSAIIVRQVRLPQVITAALAGSGLAAAGHTATPRSQSDNRARYWQCAR